MVVVAGGRSSAPMDWRWGRRNEWREKEREREREREREGEALFRVVPAVSLHPSLPRLEPPNLPKLLTSETERGL